jgi:cyclic pyranopterin phosphate synthase
MEALTVASIAGRIVYDFCKRVDRGMSIGPIQLEEKSGGRSGHWRRSIADQLTAARIVRRRSGN